MDKLKKMMGFVEIVGDRLGEVLAILSAPKYYITDLVIAEA